ncbi:MAG: radical SAM protein [Deltaproteobacteria bacterium]|uniref:Radical SAM protein n=1 Tax=Candidatus Zymogenus saltonus TaxID=2844893 RepID=A0A9D8KHC5_9DELT|nr:radical SAM protein [Candidatus Zymogenus saltonus]
MSYIFGPVPSRRLGRSLGIDLVPFKTCTYDCIYCQLGATTNRTMERGEWFPLDKIVSELKEKLDTRPDYITLSGSGEPTLYSRIGDLIEAIRLMTDVPVAVLTNGSLLWQKEVRRGLIDANLVIPSLDAGDASTFEAVNRPVDGIDFEEMVEGLVTFRSEHKGDLWLEVFLLDGYNAAVDDVKKIAAHALKIGPDRVQLNTVTRPPSEEYALAVNQNRMKELAKLFEPQAEVIADFRSIHKEADFASTREDIVKMLQRRPCTTADIADGLGIHRNEVVKYIEELFERGLLEQKRVGEKVYYFADTNS